MSVTDCSIHSTICACCTPSSSSSLLSFLRATGNRSSCCVQMASTIKATPSPVTVNLWFHCLFESRGAVPGCSFLLAQHSSENVVCGPNLEMCSSNLLPTARGSSSRFNRAIRLLPRTFVPRLKDLNGFQFRSRNICNFPSQVMAQWLRLMAPRAESLAFSKAMAPRSVAMVCRRT